MAVKGGYGAIEDDISETLHWTHLFVSLRS